MAGRFAHDAGLVDIVRQRLFAVDMLAQLHRGDAGDGVCVVRRGDDDRVDVLLLVEHDAKVLVPRRLGIFLELSLGPLVIDVAQGDDVLAQPGDGVGIARALAAGADDRDIELVVR